MTALDKVWTDYKTENTDSIGWRPRNGPLWGQRLNAAALLDWDDFEVLLDQSGKPHRVPVLRYTAQRHGRVYTAYTEPCLFCRQRHHHGGTDTADAGIDPLDGRRVPHCSTHTHDRTPKGRYRNLNARNVRICPGCEGNTGYILRKVGA